MKTPRIEYEVYYPLNGKTLSKLDLNKCNDLNIEIYIPLKIDVKDVDKHNSSSDFFHHYCSDICYTSKTENGADIILKDRREECVNNDMNACEENCNFTDYNSQYNKAICSCKAKTEVKKFSEININKTLLYDKFIDIFISCLCI